MLTVSTLGDGGNHDDIGTPTCLDDVIAVGTSDAVGNTASNSSNRPNDPHLLPAPGSRIRPATLDDGSATKSGTSMAAPHVVGAIALLRQARPSAHTDAVRAALRQIGTPIDDARTDGTATDLLPLDVPAAEVADSPDVEAVAAPPDLSATTRQQRPPPSTACVTEPQPRSSS